MGRRRSSACRCSVCPPRCGLRSGLSLPCSTRLHHALRALCTCAPRCHCSSLSTHLAVHPGAGVAGLAHRPPLRLLSAEGAAAAVQVWQAPAAAAAYAAQRVSSSDAVGLAGCCTWVLCHGLSRVFPAFPNPAGPPPTAAAPPGPRCAAAPLHAWRWCHSSCCCGTPSTATRPSPPPLCSSWPPSPTGWMVTWRAGCAAFQTLAPSRLPFSPPGCFSCLPACLPARWLAHGPCLCSVSAALRGLPLCSAQQHRRVITWPSSLTHQNRQHHHEKATKINLENLKMGSCR